MTRDELDQALDEMRWAGFPESAIEEARQEAQGRWQLSDGAYDVHPANALAVRLLLATATQWRNTSLNTTASAVVVRTGLDYATLELVARLEDLGEISPDAFRRVRICEAEALAAWAEQRARAQ
jgi:hypothetical protein